MQRKRQIISGFYDNPSENGFSSEIFKFVNDLSKMEFEGGNVTAGSGIIASAGNTGAPSRLEKIINLDFDHCVFFTRRWGQEFFRTPILKLDFFPLNVLLCQNVQIRHCTDSD